MPRYNWHIVESGLKTADVHVQPHWQNGDKVFWYLRKTARREFWKVEIDNGKKQLAFEHEKVAGALSQHKSEEFDPWDLPFSQITLDLNSDTVFFRLGAEKFKFDQNQGLESFQGSLDEGKLESDLLLRQSEPSTTPTELVIINRTEAEVICHWIDNDGNLVSYAHVDSNDSRLFQTYVDHVWQVTGLDGQVLGKYKAVNGASIVEVSNDAEDEAAGPPPKGLVVIIDGESILVSRPDGSTYELKGSLPAGTQWVDHVDESQDRRFVVAWQTRPQQDHPLLLIDHAPTNQLLPETRKIQYPRPGDDVEILRPRLFELKTKQEIDVSDELFKNPFRLDTIGWCKDSSEFLFMYNERGHQVLRVLAIEHKGAVRIISEDKSTTFIDYSQKQYFDNLEGTKELLWASERDGWNRLYLINIADAQIQPITPSGEVVVSVDRVEAQERRVWYKVRGSIPDEDPYYNHLVRVNFDGSGYTRLTQGDGTHTWTWSPDHAFLIDQWSRIDEPSRTVLRDGETGEELMLLEAGHFEAALRHHWTAPEPFHAPGRDGQTLIYGVIIKPSTFDPEKRYPVIECIYAGPQDFFVPKKIGSSQKEQELAEELDCVVVIIDGMGTNWRGKAFHDVCWKNLKDAGFPDRIAWMRTAAIEREWMDLQRVGIYGVSAGGQNALGALLWHGDFYKAAVADSGCHDNRVDKLWWNEQWMGWPVDESYEKSSNVVNAHRLEGKLMLVVGLLDTNVDPACTIQVVKALNDADKDYELVIDPTSGHGVLGDSKYADKRMRAFFRKHLK